MGPTVRKLMMTWHTCCKQRAQSNRENNHACQRVVGRERQVISVFKCIPYQRAAVGRVERATRPGSPRWLQSRTRSAWGWGNKDVIAQTVIKRKRQVSVSSLCLQRFPWNCLFRSRDMERQVCYKKILFRLAEVLAAANRLMKNLFPLMYCFCSRDRK